MGRRSYIVRWKSVPWGPKAAIYEGVVLASSARSAAKKFAEKSAGDGMAVEVVSARAIRRKKR